jgi:hypothetical protein
MQDNYPNIFLGLKTQDLSFIRKVIVATLSFLYDTIYIPEIVDDKLIMERVPIYYSRTGDWQFLVDHFVDNDKYCRELGLNKDGNVNSFPAGVMTFTGIEIISGDRTNKYERMMYYKDKMDEFGGEVFQMSARTELMPIGISMEITWRSTTDLQRFKIWESVTANLYRSKDFAFNYNGFDRLPCSIGFPDNSNMNKNFNFSVDSPEDYIEFTSNLELLTYLPVGDKSTERYAENVIEKFTKNIDTNE